MRGGKATEERKGDGEENETFANSKSATAGKYKSLNWGGIFETIPPGWGPHKKCFRDNRDGEEGGIWKRPWSSPPYNFGRRGGKGGKTLISDLTLRLEAESDHFYPLTSG